MNIDGEVGYEIFVESFYDSNNDGIGDINGITEKLEYLKDLGVTLLWLTPFMSSPQVDNGYDVSDYYSVDKRYGSMEDLKNLLAETHKRGMKVIMDFVMNHTSDQHEWFELSRRKVAPYDAYYIWRDVPNNWIGFAGEAWKYDEVRKQYYFHIFNEHQPDLNYENPLVLKEMLQIAEFYLKLGIDGFRLDAVSHLSKEHTFRDSSKCAKGEIDTNKYSNRKEVFEYLRPLKELCEEYHALVVGEVGGNASMNLVKKFTNPKNGIMDIAFTFNQCWMNDMYGIENAAGIGGRMFTPKRFIREYMTIYNSLHLHSQIVNYWLNHDHPRLRSQYGDDDNTYSLSALAALLYMLPGMPFIYYGEEIGMRNVRYTSIEEFHDAGAIEYLEKEMSDERFAHLNRVNRDSSRSPFEWNDSKYCGFSKVKPYRSIGEGTHQSAETQMQEPKSLWNFYRALIALRTNSQYSFINHPDSLVMDEIDSKVIHYVLKSKEHRIEGFINLSPEEVKVQMPTKGQIRINNYEKFDDCLLPYQAIILEN